MTRLFWALAAIAYGSAAIWVGSLHDEVADPKYVWGITAVFAYASIMFTLRASGRA